MWKSACLIIGLAVLSAASAEEKVPVSVYYESLCPDSIAFVTQQLVPAHETGLKNYMDLEMIPYGKSSQQRSADGKKWEFKCHHGPVECYGNKVHGCVLKQVPSEETQLRYLDCLMRQAKTTRSEFPLTGCLNGTDLNAVESCANDTQPGAMGSEILAGNGNETARLDPPLTSVPTILFNGVFNKSDSDLAQKDFKKVLCSYLRDECPMECKSAAPIAVSHFSPLAAILILAGARFI